MQTSSGSPVVYADNNNSPGIFNAEPGAKRIIPRRASKRIRVETFTTRSPPASMFFAIPGGSVRPGSGICDTEEHQG